MACSLTKTYEDIKALDIIARAHKSYIERHRFESERKTKKYTNLR